MRESTEELPPLNIALVHTSDQGGGAEQSTIVLHEALRKLGHRSRVFVGTKKSDLPDVHQIQRFRCIPGVLRTAKWLEDRLGWQYLYHPWFRQLDRLLGEVDILHFQSLWSGREGYADVGALPRLTRLYPSVLTLRDWWMLTGHCAIPAPTCERWKSGCGSCPDLTIAPAIDVDGTRFNWKRKLRSVQQSQLRVTTVSNWLKGLVRESPIFAGKQVHTVHNGIDEQVFYPRNRSLLRKEFELPQDAFIVLVTGQSVHGTSVAAQKQAPQYALEACRLSGVKPFLLAVGRSSQGMVAEWAGAGRATEFQSSQESLAKLYCAADVVLVASLWETFGRVPAEAQMCGVPVVAFSTGGIPEIVEHGVTGLLAERLDGTALGQALKSLHDAPDVRLRMGRAASSSMVEKFSNLAVARSYVELYREEIRVRKHTVPTGAAS